MRLINQYYVPAFRTVFRIITFLVITGAAVQVRGEVPVLNRIGQPGIGKSTSAITLGMGRVAFNLYNEFAASDFTLKLINPPSYNDMLFGDSTFDTFPDPSSFVYNLYPSLNIGIAPFANLSLSLPVYFDNFSDYAAQSGIGDLEMSLLLSSGAPRHLSIIDVGLLSSMSLPTGDRIQGYFPRRAWYYLVDSSYDSSINDAYSAYYTSKNTELEFLAAFTLDPFRKGYNSPLLLHVSSGLRFVFSDQLDNVFIYRSGIELRPFYWLDVFLDFSGETRLGVLTHKGSLVDDPIRLSPGFSLLIPGGLTLTAGMDMSLMSDTTFQYKFTDETVVTRRDPRWKFNFSLGWSGFILKQDSDRDNIADRDDRCPYNAEDIDGFEDSDGCPDPDNDNDGIADEQDKCPKAAEEKDGFEDADGCPDYDNDRDGVPDSVDKCKFTPEDRDGFEDNDGCPDLDNDRDGVPDSIDKCINVREDPDGFQDRDGCPDIDNDQDGIADSIDRCPDQYGTREYNGCQGSGKGSVSDQAGPREIKQGRVILKGVDFQQGSAVFMPQSYTVLDQLCASLNAWPDVKIEIRGHTDGLGDAAENMRISKLRAEAVRNYLIGKGIQPHRLKSVGKGRTEPLTDDRTAEGRAMNRRMEIIRFDR